MTRLQTLFFELWWVLLFVLICYFFYEQGLREQKRAYQRLSQRMAHLENMCKEAVAKRDDLRMQINSQSDPAWIELRLMEGLGMVPEGQVKVYFKT